MDSGGQHPADLISKLMAVSQAQSVTMVLGKLVFSADAPALCVNGRKVSNGWVNLETLWLEIGCSPVLGRCFAFSLPARQRAADVDAYAVISRITCVVLPLLIWHRSAPN
ncbi:MAG: glycosyl transferase family protein [uncultured bacterium]|nr:MAG: glycosyl transferase family protein [uncultured bacterium]